MKETIAGKKLLILGGTTLMINVVRIAKSMGVYTVVTDMYPSSPAKQVADKSYDISTGDFDDLLEMAKSERIDGVFAGYDDFNTSVAVKLAEKLGLCFYANNNQIDVTKDKQIFKNLCRDFDVPVVKEYSASDVRFPCVVKPVDSYSAKGITVCRSLDELQDAIDYALKFSGKKNIIIEKYMDPSTSDCVNIDYLLSDGEIVLSAVGDKKVVKQDNKAPLTSAVFYPSKYLKEYISDVDSHVKEMFSSLGMKNGTVFIECFYDKNDGFAVYEMGYRVGGGQSSIILDHLYNIDYVKMLIEHTLTGKMCSGSVLNKCEPDFPQKACGLVIIIKPGTISRISGMDLIRNINGVINITQYLHVGSTVSSSQYGTLMQTFARVHIVADSIDALEKIIEEIYDDLSVCDGNGNNLIVKNIPTY